MIDTARAREAAQQAHMAGLAFREYQLGVIADVIREAEARN